MEQSIPLTLTRRELLVKVPEVTIYFWIIKLLTTALGESTSDYLVNTISPYVAVGLGSVGFVIALILQFSVKRYIPWVYWLMVLMVSIFGTMAADVTHIVLGVPYAVSAATFLIVLAIVFLLWYRSERCLSIHSIYTTRREIYYWATVLATFALGTAAGDMSAMTWKLGYFSSGILFAVLFLLPGIFYALFRRGPIFTFWFSYIMTRPLGASFADWSGKSHSVGGLGYGDGRVSLVLFIAFVVLVAYLSVTRVDVPQTPQKSR